MILYLVIPFIVAIIYYIAIVRLTGRPPADFYDALKDIWSDQK